MLKRFAFRAKMYYLCTSEEERALNTGLSPLFLAIIKEEIHRKLKILSALADFQPALAEIFGLLVISGVFMGFLRHTPNCIILIYNELMSVELGYQVYSKLLKRHDSLIISIITTLLAPEMTNTPNFLGFSGERIDDIGNRNVKRYLFFEGAFLTFRVTTQVVVIARCGLAVREWSNVKVPHLACKV